MKNLLSLVFFALCFIGQSVAQNNNTQSNNNNTSGEDLNNLMEMLQDEELGNSIQELGKQLESLQQAFPEDGDASSLMKLYQQEMNMTPEESANMREMIKMVEQEAQENGSIAEIERAMNSNGQIQRKGDYFQKMSDDEFTLHKNLIAVKYAFEVDPNSTEASRRTAIRQYLSMDGKYAVTQEHENILYSILEADRTGERIDVYDINIHENGETFNLGETIEESAKEAGMELNANYDAMKKHYKSMSYQEFRTEMLSQHPDEEMTAEKEGLMRELYNDVQANDGDLLKAVFIFEKRHENDKK